MAYRVKSSLDLFLLKSYVKYSELLSLPVKQKVMLQKSDFYISLKLQLNRLIR